MKPNEVQFDLNTFSCKVSTEPKPRYDPYPHQMVLHRAKAENLAAIGGNGSGKSQFLLWEAIFAYALIYPGCDCLLLRRNFKELERGLIKDLLDCVPNPDGQIYTYHESKHVATFFNGSKIYFGHCENNSEKDLHQYLSSQFVFIGIDEAGQFSHDAWDFLKSRNRVNPNCKPDSFGKFPLCKMGIATNPLGPGWGWVKTVFVDKEPPEKPEGAVRDDNGVWWIKEAGEYSCIFNPADYEFAHSTILDNVELLAKDPGYIGRLQRLAPALRKKALYGDMNAVTGQYYSNFEKSHHVINLRREPDAIKWQDWQPHWIGWDFGMGHFSAIYFCTRALLKKLDGSYKAVTVVYREIVDREKSSRDLVRRIHDTIKPGEKIQHIFFSHEKFSRTVDTAHRPADDVTVELRKYGLPPVTRASNDRMAGAVLLYNLLEYGDIVFLDSCPEIIKAIPALQRKETNLEDVEKTETKADDCFDGLKYALLSMLSPKHKSAATLASEKAAQITDPITRHFYVVKQQDEAKKRTDTIKPNNMSTWKSRLQ